MHADFQVQLKIPEVVVVAMGFSIYPPVLRLSMLLEWQLALFLGITMRLMLRLQDLKFRDWPYLQQQQRMPQPFKIFKFLSSTINI